jgi:hypothetical protein
MTICLITASFLIGRSPAKEVPCCAFLAYYRTHYPVPSCHGQNHSQTGQALPARNVMNMEQKLIMAACLHDYARLKHNNKAGTNVSTW